MITGMSVDEAMKMFSQDYLDMTCSAVCFYCDKSVFFQGQSWRESVPNTFRCPHCGGKNIRAVE